MEHYCRCPAVQEVLRTKLRKVVPDMQALSFLTLADRLTDDHDDLWKTCPVRVVLWEKQKGFEDQIRGRIGTE